VGRDRDGAVRLARGQQRRANGLFYGDASLLGKQLIPVFAAGAYSFLVTFLLLKVLDRILGLRVKEEQEQEGLDLSQHGEIGYTF